MLLSACLLFASLATAQEPPGPAAGDASAAAPATTTGAAAAPAAEVDVFELKVEAELAAHPPAALAAWKAANAARDAEDWAAAERGYDDVLAVAPGFSHATRRKCGVVLQQGRRDEAVALCKEALQAGDSPEDALALAAALARTPADGPLPTADLRDAHALLQKRVLPARPDDVQAHLLACNVTYSLDDLPGLASCSRDLQRLAPDEPFTWLASWVVAANDGRWDDALAHAERAKAAGVDDATYTKLVATVEENRPTWPAVLDAALVVGTAWLLGLAILVGAGAALSQAALDAATKVPDTKTGEAVGLAGKLRKAYAGVLWASCVYYYVSVPLVLLATLAIGGGLLWGVFAVGRVPVKLVIMVVVVMGVTLVVGIKSLFAAGKEDDPGESLDLAAHPRLREALHTVAAKVGTRPVDRVFLTPGTEVAVWERGGLGGQLRGSSERCLVLGVGVLDGMKVRPLKSVLAHEYGHFSNRDTAGGGFALAVRRSLLTMAQGLAEGGVAGWYNPTWLFLNGFFKVFLRISQGASRLQEVLADRWAAFCYGSAAFEEGFRHVVARSVQFDWHANATLREVIEGKKGLANLYAYTPGSAAPEGVEKDVDAALSREPSPYDSHPSPKDRIAWVRALASDGGDAEPDDDAPAWSLFEDREALERKMTDQIRQAIALNHGVAIPVA